MTHRQDLLLAFQLLAPERSKDYGPNGLQLGLEHEFIDVPNPA